MDPITLAMLGGTAISSIFGGMQAADANAINQQIGLLNYYQQQAAQRAQVAEGRRQQSEAHMGTTDAAGNRTYFVPGQGWVTDLTDTQQALQSGTEQEQLRQLIEGAIRAERVDERANANRNDEAVMAEASMDELRRARPTDTASLRQLLLARGGEARNRDADRTGNAIARQSIRAGGGGDAAELLTRGRGIADQEASRSAGIEAQIMAEQEGDRQFDHNRDRASKLYDYFRRASTSGTASPQGFMPTGPQQQSTGVANQGLINALGRAPQREYQAPNLAWTDTITDILKLPSAYRNEQRSDEMFDILKQRWGSNTGAVS